MNSYTKIDDVKVESGLADNPYILDEDVQDKIDEAQAVINSYLHGKYDLPFTPYPDAPPLIENVTRKLASAYLLQMEYGPMNPGDAKDGFAKENRIMATIEKIQKGTIVLCDKNGVTLLASNNLNTSFLPNDSTSNMTTNDFDLMGVPGQPVGSNNPQTGPFIRLKKNW